MGLKIAVAGKGGSGKTTVCALLGRILAEAGQTVLLVDLDSDPNLAGAVGVPAASALPLVHRRELIAERTGSEGTPGGMFLLNPNVSDIAARYAVRAADRLFLLPVGTIEAAGEGCFCPQTAFVRALIRRLVLGAGESLVLDLEAGLESFGRSAVEGLDLLLAVVEPGMRSVETARRILAMAPALGVRSARVVGNKIRPPDRRRLEDRLAGAGLRLDLILSHDGELLRRDLAGEPVLDHRDEAFERGVAGLLAELAGRP